MRSAHGLKHAACTVCFSTLWPFPLKGLDPRFATQQVKRVCFGDSLRSVFTVAAEPEFIGFAIASGAFGEAALNLLLVFVLEPPN